MEYLWYKVVEGDKCLSQGDLFNSCPVIVPSTPVELGLVSAEVIEYDIVVMSQSCDLKYSKVNLVLVCPIWPLNEFAKDNDYYNSSKGKEALRRGYTPGYHLLNKCDIEGFETDYLVVDFRNVYGVPIESLARLATETGPRLCLQPPYREHLSQAFARFFMRVGLPVDIPGFK
jgi:hypothetical protein